MSTAPVAAAVIWNRTLPRTRFFDALSLILPTGESFVIATIEEWRRGAGCHASAELQSEVDRLMREERSHQRAHDRYNAALIERAPDAASAADRAARVTDEIASYNLPMRLALVVAFEHLTIVLSREVLAHRALLDDADCIQARLWRWHAREEIAHGHVAADVAAHHGIGRWRASLALMLAAAFLSYDVVRCWWTLCRCDVAGGFSGWRLVREAAAFGVQALPAFLRMGGAVVKRLIVPTLAP